MKSVSQDIDAIIIPLPDKIYLLAEDVIRISREMIYSDRPSYSLLHRLREKTDAGYEYAEELSISIVIGSKNPIVLRPYFVKAIDFKDKVRGTHGLDATVKAQYLFMNMPRFIWVVEITTFSIYSQTRKILGEILFDSTANKFDYYRSCLSVHIPGYFFHNSNIMEDQCEEIDIAKEDPYDILVYKGHYACEIEGPDCE